MYFTSYFGLFISRMPLSPKRKILIGVAGSFLVLAAVLIVALNYILKKSLPETRGSARVPGLAGEVQVFRDGAGIPHILAGNEYDLYFAAGYVTAQDRLWQMDLMRRFGEGRLSEIFGSRTLGIDRMMRTIGFRQIADSLYLRVSQQTRNVLEAYAKGINASIRAMKNRYPVEFDILKYEPEEWTPRQSLLVTRLIGWELALSWWVDLTYGDLVQTLGEERAHQIFPFDDGAAPESRGVAARFDVDAGRRFCAQWLDARDFLGLQGSAVGSNSWAVTRGKSNTGLPILANDPHLPLSQPSRMYLMHLNAPGINAAGASIPGAPGIVIGHNDRIAWGLTNLMTDDVDFYAERLPPGDSTFEYRGRPLPLRRRLDSILVRDSLPVPFIVRSTLHGPIVSNVHPLAAERGAGREPVSMRWTGFEVSDEVLALYRVNHASTFEEFSAALESFGVPGQNFLYADAAGNIGAQCGALIPLRLAAAAVAPSAGWLGAGEWSGFVPYAKLPRSYNPPGDMIASANTRPAQPLSYFITHLWEGDSRMRRIQELLQDQKVFTYNDFRLMQMDVQSPYARDITRYFLDALRRDSLRSPRMTKAMNLLAQWDFRMYTSSAAAAIYNAAFAHLLHETFADEMGEDLFRQYVFLSNVPTRVMPRLLADSLSAWFDNVRTPALETRDDILVRSMNDALDELARACGADMAGWSWGRVHTVTLRHPMGEAAPLDRLFNVGPYATGGNNTTINNAEFSFRDPYRAVIGPALRMIVNLASLDTCSVIIPSGESGQPLSRHYADQTVFWLNGVYHQLISNPATVRSTDWELLTLRP